MELTFRTDTRGFRFVIAPCGMNKMQMNWIDLRGYLGVKNQLLIYPSST